MKLDAIIQYFKNHTDVFAPSRSLRVSDAQIFEQIILQRADIAVLRTIVEVDLSELEPFAPLWFPLRLENFRALKILTLSNLRLRTLDDLEAPQLERLVADGNEILHLPNKVGELWPSLVKLDVSKNNIASFMEVEKLFVLSNLRELDLCENPVADELNFVPIVQNLLPRLRYLNRLLVGTAESLSLSQPPTARSGTASRRPEQSLNSSLHPSPDSKMNRSIISRAEEMATCNLDADCDDLIIGESLEEFDDDYDIDDEAFGSHGDFPHTMHSLSFDRSSVDRSEGGTSKSLDHEGIIRMQHELQRTIRARETYFEKLLSAQADEKYSLERYISTLTKLSQPPFSLHAVPLLNALVEFRATRICTVDVDTLEKKLVAEIKRKTPMRYKDIWIMMSELREASERCANYSNKTDFLKERVYRLEAKLQLHRSNKAAEQSATSDRSPTMQYAPPPVAMHTGAQSRKYPQIRPVSPRVPAHGNVATTTTPHAAPALTTATPDAGASHTAPSSSTVFKNMSGNHGSLLHPSIQGGSIGSGGSGHGSLGSTYRTTTPLVADRTTPMISRSFPVSPMTQPIERGSVPLSPSSQAVGRSMPVSPVTRGCTTLTSSSQQPYRDDNHPSTTISSIRKGMSMKRTPASASSTGILPVTSLWVQGTKKAPERVPLYDKLGGEGDSEEIFSPPPVGGTLTHDKFWASMNNTLQESSLRSGSSLAASSARSSVAFKAGKKSTGWTTTSIQAGQQIDVDDDKPDTFPHHTSGSNNDIKVRKEEKGEAGGGSLSPGKKVGVHTTERRSGSGSGSAEAESPRIGMYRLPPPSAASSATPFPSGAREDISRSPSPKIGAAGNAREESSSSSPWGCFASLNPRDGLLGKVQCILTPENYPPALSQEDEFLSMTERTSLKSGETGGEMPRVEEVYSQKKAQSNGSQGSNTNSDSGGHIRYPYIVTGPANAAKSEDKESASQAESMGKNELSSEIFGTDVPDTDVPDRMFSHPGTGAAGGELTREQRLALEGEQNNEKGNMTSVFDLMNVPVQQQWRLRNDDELKEEELERLGFFDERPEEREGEESALAASPSPLALLGAAQKSTGAQEKSSPLTGGAFSEKSSTFKKNFPSRSDKKPYHDFMKTSETEKQIEKEETEDRKDSGFHSRSHEEELNNKFTERSSRKLFEKLELQYSGDFLYEDDNSLPRYGTVQQDEKQHPANEDNHANVDEMMTPQGSFSPSLEGHASRGGEKRSSKRIGGLSSRASSSRGKRTMTSFYEEDEEAERKAKHEDNKTHDSGGTSLKRKSKEQHGEEEKERSHDVFVLTNEGSHDDEGRRLQERLDDLVSLESERQDHERDEASFGRRSTAERRSDGTLYSSDGTQDAHNNNPLSRLSEEIKRLDQRIFDRDRTCEPGERGVEKSMPSTHSDDNFSRRKEEDERNRRSHNTKDGTNKGERRYFSFSSSDTRAGSINRDDDRRAAPARQSSLFNLHRKTFDSKDTTMVQSALDILCDQGYICARTVDKMHQGGDAAFMKAFVMLCHSVNKTAAAGKERSSTIRDTNRFDPWSVHGGTQRTPEKKVNMSIFKTSK